MTQACEQWHGAIAVEALGGLEPVERAGLLAHLDGCAACREEARSLGEVASALALVDADAVPTTASLPPALTERVLGSLHDEARLERRRRRTGVAAMAGAVVAVAAALVAVLALSVSPSPRVEQRTVALSGAGASATVVLSSRSWGTEVRFSEQGLVVGQLYDVSMRTSSGSWWSTGTLHPTSGHVVGAQMACPYQLGQITGMRVTDASGTSVLRSSPGADW